MILTDKQQAALQKFASGTLLSPGALMKLVPGMSKVEAVNRIAELRDKGALRKQNQTQYMITKKGLEALGLLSPTGQVATQAPKQDPVPELDADDDKPLSDAEMDRLLDGAVEELAEDSIATLAAFDVNVSGLQPDTTYKATVTIPDSAVQDPAGDQTGVIPRVVSITMSSDPTSLGHHVHRTSDDIQIDLKVEPHPDERAAAPHPALVAIEQLKDQLTKPKPLHIDKLDVKKEALVALGRFLAQDICDLLVEIADDLDRAAGNEI